MLGAIASMIYCLLILISIYFNLSDFALRVKVRIYRESGY